MRRSYLFAACTCLALAAGCAYRGAVYSEYAQFALDIRTTQESSAPVMVNVGYDRGVLAHIPKRSNEANSLQGEAVSVISWNNLATEPNPVNAITGRLLKADAGFISGIAANVAAAPDNATVVIVPAPVAREVPSGLREQPVFSVETKGNPGERIAAAVTPTPYGPDENTEKIKQWIRSDPGKNRLKLRTWLNEHGYAKYGIANVLDGKEFSRTREDITRDLALN